MTSTGRGTQVIVFALVGAGFLTIYVTQPVLPVISAEFGVTPAVASLTVSAVVLGIAVANLPFGVAADRWPIARIVLAGGGIVAAASGACALTHDLRLLIAARFVQGLFIPALSTCVAAYLSRVLPPQSLGVMMGWYVSATVAGGLGGRLLGGLFLPVLHWRAAFLVAGTAVLLATGAAALWLPRDAREPRAGDSASFAALFVRPELLRMFAVGFSSFFVFSAMFNYIPFYLSGPPLHAPVRLITLLYLAYVAGIAAGPLAGRLTGRLGTGMTLICGSLLLAGAIALTLVPSLPVIAFSLVALCGGFFAVHAAAVGSLNQRLTSGRGRANSIYVLAYYLGGAAGITATGAAYARWGWHGAVPVGIAGALLPLAVGAVEASRTARTPRAAPA